MAGVVGDSRPGDGERAKAADARERLLAPGRRVLRGQRDVTPTLVVFQGFLARAQALHESSVTAIEAGNPVAAFTLLRAHAENAAGILFAKDHPQRVGSFWVAPGTRPVKIGQITTTRRRGSAAGLALGLTLSPSEPTEPIRSARKGLQSVSAGQTGQSPSIRPMISFWISVVPP
jgi:hypothetical protein